MPTINQLIKKSRKIKINKKKDLFIGAPQKKGIVLRIFTVSPRKPNSANRKVAKIKLSTGYIINAYIPGENHNLQEHSMVLVKGGRTKDLTGYRFKVMRGLLDCSFVMNRKRGRSKYGVKKVKD